MHQLRRRASSIASSFVVVSIIALRFLLVQYNNSSSLLLPSVVVNVEVAKENEDSASSDLSTDPQQQHRSLRQLFRLDEYNDPKTVTARTTSNNGNDIIPAEATAQRPPPIRVCGRAAPIRYESDLSIHAKYRSSCPLLASGPRIDNEDITLIYLGDVPYAPYGQTGNNIIELLHAMQYAHDHNDDQQQRPGGNAILGMKLYTWPTHLLTMMWMEMPTTDTTTIETNDDNTSSETGSLMSRWKQFVEETLCIRIITTDDELLSYKAVIEMTNTKDLFRLLPHFDTDDDDASSNTVVATTTTTLDEYIEYQCYILRSLYRYYNTGLGYQARRNGRIVPTQNMCSVIDTIFGDGAEYDNQSSSSTIQYSVIHSRSEVGNSLKAVARRSGTDPMASMIMEPEYIKSILRPLNMLSSPIVYIGDKKTNPDILDRLLHDEEIGPYIITSLVPQDEDDGSSSSIISWVGGDITLGTMATVFIGNPGSTFSIFIAKSRLALGFGSHTTYLFRKWEDSSGEWINSCHVMCVFDKKIVNYHS